MFSLALSEYFAAFLVYLLTFGQLVFGCGTPAIRPSLDGKIINGQEAVENSWPWMVLLNGLMDDGQELLCGGTIIDELTIVTAAHCIVSQDPSKTRVYVGLHDRSKLSKSDYYTPSNIYIHPKYDKTNIRNDIAVIQLETNITFSDRVSPVCLPRANAHNKYTTFLLYET